jgi:hypothetical protein
MKTTTSNLIRWTGLAAVMGGILFVVMQPIHPPETLAAVTTGAWATVHYLGVAMCLLNLLGIAGIYARQVEASGWLGLAGLLLFGVATLRAGVLPRWAGGALAVGTVAPLALSLLLPAEFIRLAAVPVGLALALLGYALWSEPRENVSEAQPATVPTPGAVVIVRLGP